MFLWLFFSICCFFSSLVHANFINEYLFSEIISNHNLLSYSKKIEDATLFPSELLNLNRTGLHLSYFYNDILRIKENNKVIESLEQNEIQCLFTYPLYFATNKYVLGIYYSGGTLYGKLPSINFHNLNSAHRQYSAILATKFGNYSIGIGYQYNRTNSLGGIKIEKYPRSDNHLENTYFYEPMERYFGKDLKLSEIGSKEKIIIESRYDFNFGNKCLIRASNSNTNSNFILEHFNQEKQKLQYIDIPFKKETNQLEFSFLYKLINWFSIKPVMKFVETNIVYDFVPTDADPKKEITDYGDLNFNSKTHGYGLSSIFKIINHSSYFKSGRYNLIKHLDIFISGIFSRTESDIQCCFSTPVLGYLWEHRGVRFGPIVHRINDGYGKIFIPSIQYQLGLIAKFKKFELNSVLNYQKSDMEIFFNGEANLISGLINNPINERHHIPNAIQLFYGYLDIRYKFSKNMKIIYGLTGAVPIFSDRFNEILGIKKEPYVPPDPPDVERVKRETSGGITHKISVLFSF